jgi:hypothetical protein
LLEVTLLSAGSIWVPEPSLFAYQLMRIEAVPVPVTRAVAVAAYQPPPSTGTTWYSHLVEEVSD